MPAGQTLTDRFTERLREEIDAGRWRNQPLPSERALSERFDISRVTVRRGLKQLCAEQLVEAQPGRGYFVIAREPRRAEADRARAVLFVHCDQSGRPALDSLHTGIVNGAILEADSLGLELYVTSQKASSLAGSLAERWGRDLRGVLLDWTSPELAGMMAGKGIPFVLVENDLEGVTATAVIQDNAGGIALAMDHLAERGHQAVGLVVTDQEAVHPRQRLAGFREWLLRRGGRFNPAWVARAALDESGGREAAAAILSAAERPTALVVAHREMLGGVMAELSARGLRCPEDVSLVVWGAPGSGEPAGDLAGITCVAWDREEMGRLAMRALEDRIRSGRPERMVLRVELKLTDCGSVVAPRDV
ncbi:MAG TPA: substrate-binding domain-containing protein [Planctomycetota bacterium]|nr:substrate-binding domain-containing protein [Planctomycetota bacterium]